MQCATQVKYPIHSYGRGGDLTMKPCPRCGEFDFKNSQIPTLSHLIPSKGVPGWGVPGWGLAMIGALLH